MRLNSHMFVADIAGKIIEEVTGLKIDKKMMRIGSIMPDILPHRRRQLHSPNKVAVHYRKELSRSMTKNIGHRRMSFILGLLTHYITDAFCLSHNEYVINLKKHVQYECFLDDFKTSYMMPNDIMDKINDYIAELKKYEHDIEKYIQVMNENYIRDSLKDDWKNNVVHDMDQAIIQVVTLMSQFLLDIQSHKIKFV